MATGRDDYSGRPQYELVMDVNVYDYSGSNVRFSYNLYARSKSGNGSYVYDARPYVAKIGSYTVASGNASLPFGPGGNDYAGKTIGLASGVTGYIPIANYSFTASHTNVGVIGTASLSGSINVATVPPPPIPSASTPDQITATSMRYQFVSGGTGGSPIIRFEYQYSTSPTFASGNSAVMTASMSGTEIIQNLAQTTTYYIRSRTVNAVGTSAWSTTKSGTTLTSTAPGLAVTPSVDGQSSTVAITPPPEMPSPSSYTLEYRPVGGGTTTLTGVSSPRVISPLTPGTTYEYRAAAVSGSVTSPFTAWTSLTQPNPNTSPGSYFDGSTAAKTDVTYSWAGTANNSLSRANGKAVAGWGTFASGNATSGGNGVVYRVTGGRSQAFAARVDFWAPTTAAGFHAGTSTALGSGFPVSQGGVYDGLIHVRLLSRSQRVAAMFVWVNDANTVLGTSVGDDILVQSSSTDWAPLRITASPPAGATRGALRVVDVVGDGWSLWAAGDTMLLDDAITPFNEYYFDGNTPDTATKVYVWDGAENASASRELVSLLPAPNPLIDPDCPPVPSPPRPPFIDDSCVEDDVTEWRRFSQEIQPNFIHSWLDSIPILRITTNAAARLVRVRYYPNPFDRPLTQLEADSFCAEQIISYIPGDTIFTLDGVSQRVYAEVAGSSSTISADHLLRSDTNIWPALGCGIGYYVTVDVPSDTPVNALSIDYSLVHRY